MSELIARLDGQLAAATECVPDAARRAERRRRLANLVKVTGSVALIAYLVTCRVDMQRLTGVFLSAHWGYLGVALLLMVGGTVLRAVRWHVLLGARGVAPPMGELVRLNFIGTFFDTFLPSGVGGDSVLMARLARETKQAPEVIGTTLVDRALGLWVLFVLALVGLPFTLNLLPAAWLVPLGAATLAGGLAGWLAMGTPLLPWFLGRCGRVVRLPGQAKLERLCGAISKLGYPVLGRACLVSLAFNLVLIASGFSLARGLGVVQPLSVFFLFFPIISVSLFLPISIGGLGVREQTYVLLFGALGVAASSAVALSLATYVLGKLVIGAIGGALYALEGGRGLVAGRTAATADDAGSASEAGGDLKKYRKAA
jgi:hypothetical protein